MESKISCEQNTLEQEAKILDNLTNQLGWVAHRQLAIRLREYPITVSQLMVLRAIRSAGDICTMSELADAALQVSATITGIVDRLEERGYVMRTHNPNDRRSICVELTSDGLQLLETFDKRKRDRLQQFLADMSPESRREMFQMMEGYLNAIKEEGI